MKIVIFTSNLLRHKFFANSLSSLVDDALIISECRGSDNIDLKDNSSSIDQHFKLRSNVEEKFFSGNDFFSGKVLPLLYKEVNLQSTFETVKKFQPDLMLVFGSSIIHEPLISLLKPGRFINLHLGLSPYYRGSGTNFWPFINNELEYVGSTILHLDSGIDTGDIVCHVLPKIKLGDDVHTVGCRVIEESVKKLSKIILSIKQGNELPRTKQWKIPDEKYYKNNDFNENILLEYKKNLQNGLIEKFLQSNRSNPKICLFE
jgi:phosphoribosylglycinamide formyltransferase 1